VNNLRDLLLSNRIVGLVLLVLLAVVAGPNTLPRLLSSVLPGVIYEGVPCAWLRAANDRADHQSLLGRAAPNPLQLRVQTTAIPTDPAGSLFIQITVVNESLGTVPIVYSPRTVIVGDNGTNGLGLIFTPQANLATAGTRTGTGAVTDGELRLLGPRQRCVHTEEFPAGNVLVNSALASGQTTVRAYYRNNTSGSTVQEPGVAATPIFNDQGLWTGYLESDAVSIPLSSP
jgi:hypothetical protein